MFCAVSYFSAWSARRLFAIVTVFFFLLLLFSFFFLWLLLLSFGFGASPDAHTLYVFLFSPFAYFSCLLRTPQICLFPFYLLHLLLFLLTARLLLVCNGFNVLQLSFCLFCFVWSVCTLFLLVACSWFLLLRMYIYI